MSNKPTTAPPLPAEIEQIRERQKLRKEYYPLKGQEAESEVADINTLLAALAASQREIESLKLNLDKQTQEVVRTVTQTADCVQALAASQQRVAELETARDAQPVASLFGTTR